MKRKEGPNSAYVMLNLMLLVERLLPQQDVVLNGLVLVAFTVQSSLLDWHIGA